MKNENVTDVNRRDFLRGGSFASLMMLMGGVPLHAADEPKGAETPSSEETKYKGETTTIRVGVIGCGPWSRELLKTLATIPHGPVVAICDTYASAMRRAGDLAPKAQKYEDYKQLLADKEVQAVVVATPSHLHREIVLEAIKAGKHVYCEAPMATTLEDARAIARAARDNPGLCFQVGLQNRADRQIYSLADFIRSGVLGRPIKGRQQFHKKQMWRQPSPNADREKAINWRLDKTLSLGLVGELGIHQIDIANWYLNGQPVAASGFGSIVQWKDGRDVPDNLQVLLEYSNGVFLQYEATLGNSFDAEMGTFYGTDCAIMMRERRAWMFKEADAPLLGWEVYARKDAFYKESGIVLGAGSSKQETHSAKGTAADVVDPKPPLQYAFEAFLKNCDVLALGVADFKANFDASDKEALKEYLAGLAKSGLRAPGWEEGYESAVTVIKANEAAMKGQRIAFEKGWFELG